MNESANTPTAPAEGARRDPRLAALTCLGLGHFRPAPGTWGSLPPAGLAWLLLLIGVSAPVYIGGLLALAALSGWACVAWGALGEQAFGGKDARAIVIDEVAGQSLALALLHPALLPAGALALTGVGVWLDKGLIVAAGFLLFRALDIVKPYPAGAVQRLEGGLGVLLDDLIAGLYAGAVVLVGLWTLVALGALASI